MRASDVFIHQASLDRCENRSTGCAGLTQVKDSQWESIRTIRQFRLCSNMYSINALNAILKSDHAPGGGAAGILANGSKGCSRGTLFSRSCCSFLSFSANASFSYLAMTWSMLTLP